MSNVYSLNVFVRYAPIDSNLRRFYEHVVGLPLLRTYGRYPADLYWAGEVSIFETVEVAANQPAPDPDPNLASCIPIFRTPNLATALDTFRARGLVPVRLDGGVRGQEAVFLDPMDRLFGLRECESNSARREDVEARRRAARGEAFNPGCAPMPSDIQELGWIVRRCADLEKQSAFYETALGLTRIADEDDRHRFDLGDNVVLELARGGVVLPDAQERYDNTDAIILRVADTEALRQSVVEHAGRIVTEKLGIYWADLAFLSDPEGFVFGVEQALHPGAYCPEKPALSENLEATRRWRERPSRP